LSVVFETYAPLPPTVVRVRHEPADPDQALVDAWVNRGDADALAELVRLHQAYVFRLALSVLGPGFEADAEDVAQEAFIRAAERLQGFRGECRFLTWLHRLTLNLALDRRRRARWSRPHLDLEVLERRADRTRERDPFTVAAEAERARRLHRCLDGLPESLRSVIHLRYWLDLPIEEIAATLRIPLGTVKSHLHRGRTLLLRAMDATGPGRRRLVPGAPRPERRATAAPLTPPPGGMEARA
jgi:RNA polymerase sigma-70 factor, ECF subfamily